MKLTLRELFLLVALVAMGCGWWVERQEKLAAAERAYRMKRAIHHLVSYLNYLDRDPRVNYETGGVEFRRLGR
jgi:hypothetical protein